MVLRLIAALCLVLCAGMAQAQSIPGQAGLARIAAECGEDASRPSFSQADYAKAMVEAEAALASARKGTGNTKDQIAAIDKLVGRMKECQKEEEIKFVIPPMSNCSQFVAAYTAFSVRAVVLLSEGKRTKTEVDSAREKFRPAAEKCMKDIMTKCVDPTKTSHVDHLIRSFFAASDFVKTSRVDRLSPLTQKAMPLLPGVGRPSLCKDTDWSCKGDPAACKSRIDRLKTILNSWSTF